MPVVFLGHIDSIWSSEVNAMYLSKFIGMLVNQPLHQSLNSVFQNGFYEFTRLENKINVNCFEGLVFTLD